MGLNVNWLRQCRRAGLYEQGKAIYEKGGLNLANLTDEQQIEAEDDYRICVRRGRDEETKPRRQRPKTTEDDLEETTMTEWNPPQATRLQPVVRRVSPVGL